MPVRDGAARATVTVAQRRRWEVSFRAEWHNLIRRGIGPAERIDANGLEILGKDLSIGGAAEGADHQSRTVGALRDIALDAVHQLRIARLQALELTGKR